MRGSMLKMWLLPVFMAVGLAACDQGVNAGYVNTAATRTAGPVAGGTGRVVSINDVSLRGGGGGSGRGSMIGGAVGGIGGAAVGAATSRSVAGGIVGGLLGAIGGAIAGSIFDNHGAPASGGRGIEVTVQRDDGQTVTIAQRDDGDIQLGDRVQIVQDRQGVARVVRDNSRAPDAAANGQPASHGGPSQSDGPQGNAPPAEYGETYRQSRSNYPQPQNDPRYGTLN